MRKTLWASAVAMSVALGSVSPAQAAPMFTYFDNIAGEFRNTAPGATGQAGAFNDTFVFDTTKFLLGSFTFSSTGGSSSTSSTYLNFTSAKINDTPIPILISAGSNTRTSEGNLLDFRLPAGMQTLTLVGTRGRFASYNGSFSLAAVPETSTWAMMIAGFGMIGGAMRRKTLATRKAVLA